MLLKSRLWVILTVVFLALPVVRAWKAPSPPAVAQGFRALQLWPDRSVGVASGQLVGPAVVTDTQILPVGVCYGPDGTVVHGRTYLHFPMSVFPPGSEIRRATLYLYVNTYAGTGKARLGVYRVLESWAEGHLERAPTSWPSLLDSPVGVTQLDFGLPTPTTPISPTPTALPTPTSTPTTVMLLPSPTPVVTYTPTTTPRLPTPVHLEEAPERRLTWDVTVLLRAWLSGESVNNGLAVASAPQPDAPPEVAGALLAAQRLIVGPERDTRPYLIVEFDVYTPTPSPTAPSSPLPTPTPIVVLPPAGVFLHREEISSSLIMLLGLGLLLTGLALGVRHPS